MSSEGPAGRGSGTAEALARFLGLSPRQLYRRCERLGVKLRREKSRLRGK